MTRQESWERWKMHWQHGFFALALGLTTLGAMLPDPGDEPWAFAVRLALVAALGGWYVYWFVVRRDSTPKHLPYLIGAAALWAVMAAVDPAMLQVGLAALVPYCLRHTLVIAAGAVVLAGAWLLRQSYVANGGLNWSTVLACVLGLLVVLAVTGYVAMLDREGRKRQRLLDELSAAQAELAASERRAGMLAERARLARDIHDTLTQGFASISMHLDAVLADFPPDRAPSRRVEQAMHTARENLAESRRLVEALRPVHLDGTRLPEAVRQLTCQLYEETGIAADSVVTGEPVTLDPAAESAMLRIVQEALTNVRRHAAADDVTVTLSYLDDSVVVDVCDDGQGFEADASSDGVGLAAMRERVDDLGGTLVVESAPGEGATIAVTVPVTAMMVHADGEQPEAGSVRSNDALLEKSIASQ